MMIYISTTAYPKKSINVCACKSNHHKTFLKSLSTNYHIYLITKEVVFLDNKSPSLNKVTKT